MEKQCNCGGTGDCVSRKDYKKALEATAYLAEKVKILEEKYKLALFSTDEVFQPPAPPEKTQDLESLKPNGNGWGKAEWNEDNQINISMANPLPPGLSEATEIKMDDKDIELDEECMSCGA